MSNNIAWNKPRVIGAIACGSLFVYMVYRFMPLPGHKYHVHHVHTWKEGNRFLPIPESLVKKNDNIKVIHKTAILSLSNKQSLDVAYIEAIPEKPSNSFSVVFLHGAHSSSEAWVQLGSLRLIAAMGYSALAVDLPGWGKTAFSKDVSKDNFLYKFVEKLELKRPIIVAESMGGLYSLPYLLSSNSDMCLDQARGFIAMGITGTEAYSAQKYHRCHVPVMVVYGEKDKAIGLNSVGDLRNFANNEIFPMSHGNHTAHHEKPDEWHALLYNFVRIVGKRT